MNNDKGAFKEDGTKINFEQFCKIDEARVTLDAEAAANKYKTDRTNNESKTYLIEIKLDLLWHAIDADTDLKSKFSAFYNSIKEVKDANPKP